MCFIFFAIISEAFEIDRESLGGNDRPFGASQFRREVAPILVAFCRLQPVTKN